MTGVQTCALPISLLEKGIIMDKHRLSYHIRFNELNGTFCSGNLLPTKATYSLTEKKVPRTARLKQKFGEQQEAPKKKHWWSRG